MNDIQKRCTQLGIAQLGETLNQGRASQLITVKDAINAGYEQEAALLTGVTNLALIFLSKLEKATGKPAEQILQDLALEIELDSY